VFGSDLSKGHTATARANALFECVFGACLVLKFCALPEHSRGAEWAAERINYKLSPSLWRVLNAHMGPLQWNLMASDANTQAVAAGGSTLPHNTRWPAVGSSGVNVFSQTLTARPGLYANPVFGMMLQFLSLVRDRKAKVVLVAPGLMGRFDPRGNMVAPLDGVRHGPGLASNEENSWCLSSTDYGWRVGTGGAGPLGCLGCTIQWCMSSS
jgi:hypothetical protein